MLYLNIAIYKASIMIFSQDFALDQSQGLVPAMETALSRFCKDVNVSPPLWLDKNTREFVKFRQTVFWSDAFLESVNFDRMILKLHHN